MACATRMTLFVLLFHIQAEAEPIRFSFAGTLHTVNDTGSALPDDITVGAPFSGHTLYDPDMAKDLEKSPLAGEYLLEMSYTINLGEHTLEVQRTLVNVIDNQPLDDPPGVRDAFLILNAETTTLGNLNIANMAVLLKDLTASVFDSDALPLPSDGVTIDDFTEGERSFVLNGSGPPVTPFTVVGTIDSIAFDVVPEPATFVLVLAGSLFAGRRRGLRRR